MFNKIKAHEYLRLWRRRTCMTAREMGETFGVLADQWRAWERGKGKPPSEVVKQAAEFVKETPISTGEFCLIMRERKGLRQSDVAKALGVSSVTVCHMETGRVNAERLAHYWDI